MNEKSCVDSGYSREELLSMSIFDIDPNFTIDTHTQTWTNASKWRHAVS